MKIKIYKTIGLLLALACFAPTNAKTLVKLKINHNLGGNAFTKNTQINNSLGHNFNITRLEYYISSIIVIHDGGTLDTIKDKYLLVEPSGASETFDLDSLNFTNIEAIQFGIGVDKAKNNGNPANYFPGHPLAPKSPSMHWGWTAGYRFIAIEGKAGTSMNQTYELHGLWNENYYSVRIPATTKDENGAKVIELNADYSKILLDISLNSGVIAHGDNTTDRKALQNMRDSVFTNTNGATDILSTKRPNLQIISSYPNPSSTNKEVQFFIENSEPYLLKIFNIQGKFISKTDFGVTKVTFAKPGFYWVQAYSKQGKLIAVKKQLII